MNATSPVRHWESCPPTLGRAIPATTSSLTLRRLRRRYEDRYDPVVAAMPTAQRAAMITRIETILDNRRQQDGAA